ncbi:diguanylate cyclase [Paraburkholderia kirstenboschensis]|uniref:diguanylate cyclase n=1 Tax=Paraburkholderia kirstenboschensis TaxID=1245436 RepID=UPI003743F439
MRAISQTIAASVKRPTDVFARYGGKEFALVLKNTDHEGALLVGERIRRAVEGLQIRHLACGAGIVTVSCGVAAKQPYDGGDGSRLVAAADRALYTAKRAGRNRTCLAQSDGA